METTPESIFDYFHALFSENYVRVKDINSFYVSIPIIDVLDRCEDFLQNSPDAEHASMVHKLKDSLDENDNPLLITGEWNLNE